LIADWGQGEIQAATVDHGLRTEAAEEADHVAHLCEGLGIPHSILEWRGWDGKGNLQDHARRNRYRLLAEWARDAGQETVCLGHTLDDQAETFLMRLARESGLDGLSGMPPLFFRHDMRFDRPLLSERRDNLRAYLERRGVSWVDDPSNDDEGFTRVRARQALKALGPLGISPETIDSSMQNLNLSRLALGEALRETALKVSRVSNGDLVLDRTALLRQNPEVQRKLMAAALRWIASEDYPPRRDALAEASLAIIEKRNFTLHGCLMLVTDMTVRITREYNAVRGMSGPTTVLWDQRWTLDGPHASELQVRALGDGLTACDAWRETGCPRQSLLASPAIWRGDDLVSAPIAGLENGWTASTAGRDDFAGSLLSR
jgi:tRNA(Ile)-lysidine synthase